MVGHQHIGVQRTAEPGTGIVQGAQIDAVIVLMGEDRLAVVAALDDMLRLAGEVEAGKSGHGRRPEAASDGGTVAPGTRSIESDPIDSREGQR